MKKPILLASIALIFSFCSPEEKVPEAYLSPETLKKVLAEINLAEGAMKSIFILGDSANQVAPLLYEEIFKKYGTTREEFDARLNWYVKHPTVLEPSQKEV